MTTLAEGSAEVMSESDDNVTLSFTVSEDQLPGPGQRVEVTLANGMTAIIENRGSTSVRNLVAKFAKVPPRTLNYATVSTTDHASEVKHAAIVRRVNNRNRYERFTICDRNGKRIVAGLLHEPLDHVTCKQCRKMLVEDGVLPAD